MKDGNGFLVSARKYRPETFDTVVGQQSISGTLKNAIRTGHLAQAYLFCGPRGVGKTTCARIFAKTINCSNISSEIEACNHCDSCGSFNQNRSFNIHELDAASNNSVEDIRLLIEKVRIPPQVGKYNVYIIDEVHMLSQAAFNAFLKTLEEPPAHAIFIMATTEKYKIIPTILSRCQIFDFNRIRIPDIVSCLTTIAEKENITCENDALNIIAQKADGAMRDALSIFDQLASFSEGNITYKSVIENLNILDYEYYFRLTSDFLKNDVADALIIFDEILAKGFDVQNFISGLSRHFRDLLVCKAEKTMTLLEMGETVKNMYLEQSKLCNDDFLFSCLSICNECEISYKTSKNQRLHVELALIKLSNLSKKKNDSIEESTDSDTDLLMLGNPEDSYILSPTINNERIIQESNEPPAGEPEQKVPAQPRNYKKGIPSIKEALKSLNSIAAPEPVKNGSEPVELTPGEETESENSSSTYDLEKLWETYVANLKGTPLIYQVLKSQNLSTYSEGIVRLKFRNSALIAEFKSNYKQDLIQFLIHETGVKNLEIQEELISGEEAKSPKYYTDIDKLKYMTEKNPSLIKLKKDFNLDIE